MIWGCLGCGVFQLMPAVAWSAVSGEAKLAANAVVASVALFKFAYTTMGK